MKAASEFGEAVVEGAVFVGEVVIGRVGEAVVVEVGGEMRLVIRPGIMRRGGTSGLIGRGLGSFGGALGLFFLAGQAHIIFLPLAAVIGVRGEGVTGRPLEVAVDVGVPVGVVLAFLLGVG